LSDSTPRLGRWAPAVTWAACIFLFSTGWFTGERTGAILLPVLAWIFPHADHPTLEAMHLTIRKLGHFTEYLILGILVARALRGDGPWRPMLAVNAVVIAALYATTDELHQHFVPGRVAAIGDVAIDTAGAAMGQLAVAARRLGARRLARRSRTPR
jgi:VanZ family protein